MHFYLRKTARYIIALVILFSLNFLIPRMMPGDPVQYLAGEDVSFDSSALDELRENLGLNKPLSVQYVEYWKNLLRMNFGYSYHYNRSISDILLEKLKWTVLLFLPFFFAGVFSGTFFGALAGWNSEKIQHRIAAAFFLVIHSVPSFMIALIVLYLFSFKLGFFPFKGIYDTGSFSDTLSHIFLPAIIIVVFTASRIFLLMRGSIIQEKSKLYVVFARAKGLFDKQILYRHVLKNALLPVITAAALDFSFVFTGSLFIEIVFSLNGMGTLIFDAVSARDYPVLLGVFLIITVLIIGVNLLADIMYSIIDPRIKWQN